MRLLEFGYSKLMQPKHRISKGYPKGGDGLAHLFFCLAEHNLRIPFRTFKCHRQDKVTESSHALEGDRETGTRPFISLG